MPALEPAAKPRRGPSTLLLRWSGPIFAVGVALGVTFGWWAGGVTHELLQANPLPSATADVSAAPVEAARARPAAPVAAHRTAPSPPAEPAPAPTRAPSAADFVQDASATEAVPAEAVASDAVATEETRPASPSSRRPVQIARAPPQGCAAEPTPADRTICQTPHLQALQRELRRAYAEAMIVHEDRALLRRHELEWRDARNDVAEPQRLARLYDERIRRLHAATAEARRVRSRS
jgi:pilus assembly protein FimV